MSAAALQRAMHKNHYAVIGAMMMMYSARRFFCPALYLSLSRALSLTSGDTFLALSQVFEF